MTKIRNEPEPIVQFVPVELIEALGTPKPPTQIWREPFDHVRGHCERIADPSAEIKPIDFCDYFLDYRYMEVQRDLFHYVLPVALEAWARHGLRLPNEKRFKGEWHFEGMWEALVARPVHPDFLTDQQYEAMQAFLVRTLIALMRKESALSFKGSDASPYAWTRLHVTLICLFPVAEPIWKEWWSYPSTPMATCGNQWLSTLFYEGHENPFFAPWTHEAGGGPPNIFETLHMRHKPANAQSVESLKATLTKDWAFDAITRAKVALKDSPQIERIQGMLDDFSWRSALFDERVKKFITVLEAKESCQMIFWDDVPV